MRYQPGYQRSCATNLEWIIVVTQGLITVAMVVYLVWFVRKQRDWRERGKDSKHPGSSVLPSFE